MADRDPIRRTGVVYGDPRVRAPARGPSLLGQIAAAFLTIGLALGVVGVIGATLIGGARGEGPGTAVGSAAATEEPPSSGEPSSSADPSEAPSLPPASIPADPSAPPATPGAPASPSIAPAPSPTPGASLAPGLTPPPVESGTGSVVFGRSLDGRTVADPSTTFSPGETVTWVATLRAPQGQLPIVLEVYRLDEGDPERIRRELVPVGDPGRTVLRREVAVSSLVPEPGLYEVRYSFDGEELASGRLLIIP